jgi:2-dehydro-3-deoxygluconokinase
MSGVYCIGECMVELRSAGDGLLRQGYAGDSYNTAVYLKRSAPQHHVHFVTCTGNDPFSAAMRGSWRSEDVLDDLAFTEPSRRPGLYLIDLDDKGERRFHYWRGESAAKLWLSALQRAGGAALLHGADLVYVSGISLAILSPAERAQALDLMRALRGKVGFLAFDPNFRPALWPSIAEARAVMAEAAAIADIFLPSREDLHTLFGVTSADEKSLLRGLGCPEIAMTADIGQCLLLGAEDGVVQGAIAEQVVDSSGAGDSFNGAYLAARLAGQGPADAARAGLALAARVVGKAGAVVAA